MAAGLGKQWAPPAFTGIWTLKSCVRFMKQPWDCRSVFCRGSGKRQQCWLYTSAGRQSAWKHQKIRKVFAFALQKMVLSEVQVAYLVLSRILLWCWSWRFCILCLVAQQAESQLSSLTYFKCSLPCQSTNMYNLRFHFPSKPWNSLGRWTTGKNKVGTEQGRERRFCLL